MKSSSPGFLHRLRTTVLADFHLREILGKSGIHFLIQVGGILSNYLFIFLVSRYFGAGIYGTFALCYAYLNVVAVFTCLGLDTAVVKFVSTSVAQKRYIKARYYYNKIVQIIIFSGIGFSILLLVLNPFILKFVFRKSHLSDYFIIMILTLFPFVFIRINAHTIRGLRKIKYFALIIYLLPRFLSILIIALFMLISLEGGRLPFWSFAAAIYLTMIYSFYRSNQDLNSIAPQAIPVKKNEEMEVKLGHIFSVSLPMWVTSSVFLLMNWLNVLVIGVFRTEIDVGVYNVALRIAMFNSLALHAVNSIAAPKFSEMAGQKNLQGLKKLVLQSTRLTFFFSIPVLLVCVIFPRQILSFFGTEFKDGVVALVIITLGQFISTICGSVGNILNMTGHEKIVRNVMTLGLMLNLILSFLLIPWLGINGAAISFTIATLFWNLVLTYYVREKFGFWTVGFLKFKLISRA